MPMEEAEKMFPNGCEDYGISFKAYMEQQKKLKPMNRNFHFLQNQKMQY